MRICICGARSRNKKTLTPPHTSREARACARLLILIIQGPAKEKHIFMRPAPLNNAKYVLRASVRSKLRSRTKPWDAPYPVFEGSTTAYFSYDTCMRTPDCYTNSGADDRANLPASCPFDSTDTSWSTAEDCPNGWTASVAGWAVRGGLAALAPLAAYAACL